MITISLKNNSTPSIRIDDDKLKIDKYDIGEVIDTVVNDRPHKIYVLTRLKIYIDPQTANAISNKESIHEIAFDNKDFTYRLECDELARHTRWDDTTIIHFV